MMRRMRTIHETIKEIKAMDEKTSITENSIRNLCKAGKVKCILIGNRYLLDLDDLINYFSNS